MHSALAWRHSYSVRLLEDHTFVEWISKYRQWKAKTIDQLALDGFLGQDDEKHFCFISAAGCKSRWREDGERRFKFLFGKSWLWRGELIPQAETVYLCEGETDAISLIDCGMEDDGKTLAVGVQGATLNIQHDNDDACNKCGHGTFSSVCSGVRRALKETDHIPC